MQPIRIQKALSEAGVASRRAAEELVRQGRVTINGRKAEIGQSVNPDRDVIAVDGKRVYFARKKQYRYIMMNKPRGYVTTLSDELGRRCVTDLLIGVEERVYPIGRLDRNSEGLLLFTNDGELANRIMHPASHINKVYRVTVRPDITDEQAAELSAGVKIGENTTTLPATVIVLEKQPGRVVLQITISEGKNRQIRRMCRQAGLSVLRLRRVQEPRAASDGAGASAAAAVCRAGVPACRLHENGRNARVSGRLRKSRADQRGDPRLTDQAAHFRGFRPAPERL